MKAASALAHGSVDELASALTTSLSTGLAGTSPRFIVVFASPVQPVGDVVAKVAASFPDAKVIGASTAGEFTERGDAKGAACAFALAGDLTISCGIGRGLRASPERAVREALASLGTPPANHPHRTAIVLLDPLAGVSEETTAIAARELGPEVKIVGGAAGDDLAMRETQVATNDGAASDAVVIAVLDTPSAPGIGVCHGHRALTCALPVTRAEGARVMEIANRPAWDVWLAHTRAHASRHGIDVDRLTPSDEGAFLLRYEAALANEATDELMIRAPLSREADGSINFACQIPSGALIRITESGPDRQIGSSREAARRARAQLRGAPIAGALVFDCICRNLILGAQFATAIDGIAEELQRRPLAGFETYGEIGPQGGGSSLFHNTTSVVVVFPE